METAVAVALHVEVFITVWHRDNRVRLFDFAVTGATQGDPVLQREHGCDD